MDEHRDITMDDTQSVTFGVIIIAQDFGVRGHSKATMSAGSRVVDMLEAVRRETGGFAPEFNLEDFEVYRIRQPIPISSHPARYLEKVEDNASPTSEQDTGTLESEMLEALVNNLRSRGMDSDLIEKVDWRAQIGNYFQPLPQSCFQAILLCPAPRSPGEAPRVCCFFV